MAAFGEAYYGQSLSTCVNTILQKLLRQKRKAPTSEEKLQAYRKQDGKCEHCQGELDGAEEMDHCIPVKNAVAGQPVIWRALCKPCHCLLSDRQGGRLNPIQSHFNGHLYEAFVRSAKPQPATFKAN